MFRRSLQILLAATLLALAAVVGYALSLAGAPEALAEADQLVQRGDYWRAIRVLDLCEGGRSLQQDPALRERLWRLRLAANSALENHSGALQDVDKLLGERGEDLDLQLERIRLLTAIGDGERARQLAREFVAEHPEHGRALELAAGACAAAYQPLQEHLRESVVRDVGSAQTDAATAAFASFVCRPDGDDEVAQSADLLATMYSGDARLAARWATMLGDLRSLREQVQEGLGYCQRSLATDHPGSTALATWAAALDAGGRTDDMLMAGEIQRRRAGDDDDSLAAGVTGMLALLRRQQDAAAVAMALRWLPSNQVQARIDAGRIGDNTADLLLARAIAAWQLGDPLAVRRTFNDIAILNRAGIKLPITLHTTVGMVHYLNQAEQASPNETRASENNLRYVISLLQAAPQRAGWPDLLALLIPLRLQLMQKLGAPEADVLAVFDGWHTARPDALLPQLAFARHLLAANKLPAAQSVLAEALVGHPVDEELFALRLEVARADGGQSGQDGASLLAQCLQRRSPTPEVTQPIGYLLCAEAALQQKAWRIARESAALAIQAFPQLRPPRLLAIEAMLGTGDTEVAAQQARRLLDLFPLDAASAQLALRAHREAGLPTAPLLATVLPACPPTAEVRTEVLRAALQEQPGSALPFAIEVPGDASVPATLRLLAARALADAGRPADCRRLLESVIAGSDGLPADARLDLVPAIIAWTEAAAPFVADARLVTSVDHMLAHTDVRDADAAPLLLAAAARLQTTHAAAADRLLQHALAIAMPTARNGSAYLLGGRLACHLRQLHTAEERWLAALAFADGLPAAEDLARLLLAQGRADRAVQVYALLDHGVDAALAARCGQVDRAAALAGAAVLADGADLLAQATLSALGKAGERDAGRSDWQVADAPVTELRLDVLLLLRDPDLAPEALARARSLAAADPTSATTQLLLARACLQGGLYDEAARIHRDLRPRAPGPLLWREVANAAATAGYVLDPQLDADLRGAVVGQTIAGSTATLAFGMVRMVRTLEQGGYTDLAKSMQQKLWLQLPQATVHTDADVEAAAALPNPRDGWYVLSQVLTALPAPTRARARTRLYELADRLLNERGAEAKDVYELALQHLQSEGPHGCIVHFLLDHGAALPALQPDAGAAHGMLLAQIDLAAAGGDPGPWLLRSVERLLAANGPVATRTDVEAMLPRHPTSLALWHARAVVLTHLCAAEQGIRDLQHVLAHAAAPTEQLAWLELAAGAGVLRDEDAKSMAGLPAALLAAPDSAFARGLLALRTGNPDEAVPLLTGAPAVASGLHLYALALAHLQSRAADGGARARELLLRLAADYASSSLARHAGSFAAQLAPR